MMKKVFKKTLIATAFSLSLLHAPAQSAGFPVIDIASIVQAVTDYSQQLQQYAEMIEQSALSANELRTALTQYEQMVTDYEQMVKNLSDLGDLLDAGDFLEAFELVTDSNLSQFISDDFSEIADDLLDVWVAVDDARAGRFGGVKDIENVLVTIEELYADNPEIIAAAQEAFNAQNAQTSKAAANNVYLKQIDGIERKLERQTEKLHSLGPESELATLQFIGQQMVSQQKIEVAKMRQQATKDSIGIGFEEMIARKEAKAIADAAERRQASLNDEIEYPDF